MRPCGTPTTASVTTSPVRSATVTGNSSGRQGEPSSCTACHAGASGQLIIASASTPRISLAAGFASMINPSAAQ